MSVLDDIIAGVREDLSERRQSVSLEQVQEAARRAAPALDAFEALGGNLSPRSDLRVIAEVKRSSPSKGALAEITDPAALAA